MIIVLAGPPASGKTTLAEGLVRNIRGLRRSRSYTTRPQGMGEINGVHYDYTHNLHFMQMVTAGRFAEHALVGDYYYGTPKTQLALQPVLVVIDYQGTEQIIREYGDKVRTIFTFAPSREETETRLLDRGRDSPEQIARRLARAAREMQDACHFHAWVENRDLTVAARNLHMLVNYFLVNRGTGVPRSFRDEGVLARAQATFSPQLA